MRSVSFEVAQLGSPEGTTAYSLGRKPQETRVKRDSAPKGRQRAERHKYAVAPPGNAVKHFLSHEISRHALASGSPRNRAPSAKRLMCEPSIQKNPKTTGFIGSKCFTALPERASTINLNVPRALPSSYHTNADCKLAMKPMGAMLPIWTLFD